MLLYCASSKRLITVSIVPSGPFTRARPHLLNAYLRYLYSPYSYDEMEIRVNGKQIMGWTRVNNKQKIKKVIMEADLQHVPSYKCLPTYYFENLTTTSMLYLVTDKEACTSQIVQAEKLQDNGVYIFPVGVGPLISENTLQNLAGPCGNTCLPAYNYIHIN